MTFIVRAAITVTLLAILIYFIDFKTLSTVLRTSAWKLIIFASLICFVSNLTLLATRWRGLLKHAAISVPFWTLWRIQLRGTFINTVTPSSVGGDAYKLYALAKLGLHSKTTIVTSLLADRLSGLVTLLFLGGLMLLGNSQLLVLLASSELVVWGALGLLIGSSLVAFGGYMVLKSSSRPRWYTKLETARDQLRSYTQPGVIFQTIGLSVLITLIGALWLWICLVAFGAPISFTTVLLIFSLTQIAGALPISINGLGVSEGVLIFLLGFFAVSAEVALAAALVIRASLSLLSGLGYVILTTLPAVDK